MVKNHLIQRLNAFQAWCVWCAYWRLWPVLLRIKFKQFFSDTHWLHRKVTIVSTQTSMHTSASELAAQIHEAVRIAARLHFLNAECLARSIVLADMICVRGMQAKVVIGVSKKHQSFASHAWVELEGMMVAEPESIAHDFTPLKY